MLWITWTVIVLCTLASFFQFARLMGSNIRYEGRERRDQLQRWRALAAAGICDVFCALALGWLMQVPWQATTLVGAAFFGLRLTLADTIVRFGRTATGRSETVSLQEQAAIKDRLQAEAAGGKTTTAREIVEMLAAAVVLGGVSTAFLSALISLVSRLAYG